MPKRKRTSSVPQGRTPDDPPIPKKACHVQDRAPGVNAPHLTTLPFEVLSEIVLFLPTPRDLLSLSKTSSYLCQTLINPNATFLWRQVRESFGERLPRVKLREPGEFRMTEWDWIQYLLGGGPCGTCGAHTSTHWFELGIFVCTECQGDFVKTHCNLLTYKDLPRLSTVAANYAVLNVVPSMSYTSRGYNRQGTLCLKKDWDTWLERYNQSLSQDGPTLDSFHRHCQQIAESGQKTRADYAASWRAQFDAEEFKTRVYNSDFVKSIAAHEGWKTNRLFASPTLNALITQLDESLERMTLTAFRVIEPQVQREISGKNSQRLHDNKHAAGKSRLRDISKFYDDLISRSSRHVLMPSLQTFLTLPSINSLRNKSGEVFKVAKILRDSQFKLVLEDELQEWRKIARGDLAEVLGFNRDEWIDGMRAAKPGQLGRSGRDPSSATGKLHPVDRVTALFECSRCPRPKRLSRAGCMDVRAACLHVCHNDEYEKSKEPEPWNVSHLRPCTKAIRALEEILQLPRIKSSPSDADSLQLLKEHARYIVCGTCENGIAMPWYYMINHCLRHDQQPLNVMDVGEGTFKQIIQHRPLLDSSFMEKISYARTKTGPVESLVQKVIYGCRHCTQPRSNVPNFDITSPIPPKLPSEEAMEVDLTSKQRGKKPKVQLRDFNALRLHLEAKHGVEVLGPEDFFNSDTPLLSKILQ